MLNSLKQKSKTVLNFFGLIDSQGQLSRTTILFWIIIWKFVFVEVEAINLVDALMVGGSVGLYGLKKIMDKKPTPTNQTVGNTEEDELLKEKTGKKPILG